MQLFYDVHFSNKKSNRFSSKEEAYKFAHEKQLRQKKPVIIKTIMFSDDFLDWSIIDERNFVEPERVND